MKIVSITDAKNGLSALIDNLKRGSGFLIVDRGRPVARLERVTIGGDEEQAGRLARLVREGVVRPGRVTLPRTLFDDPPPAPKGDASVVAALIAERREGR
jgi:antitoxin (DNA-binding transcriptional repressor) of toxin-antitoxin stability system